MKGIYLVLLGPPGVGKGTQAERLAVDLNLPHVSSGELFRGHIEAGTELGNVAQSFIDRGELVPDAVTIGMVSDRLSRPDAVQGAVLDGFPRTTEQASALDEVLEERGESVTLVPYVDAPVATLLQRLGGRWTCRSCQVVYHSLFNPPGEPGKCDACGGELYQRPDDTPETHRKRIEVYQEQTAPLIDYYRDRGLLVEINGELSIAAVYDELLEAVRSVTRGRGACC
jgi:adenylate kinase